MLIDAARKAVAETDTASNHGTERAHTVATSVHQGHSGGPPLASRVIGSPRPPLRSKREMLWALGAADDPRDGNRSPSRSPTSGPHAMEILAPNGPVRNRLLAALPAEDLARLRVHLEPVRLQQREPLFEQEEPIHHVYFPETAVISFVGIMGDGTTVEVGTAGCEGMAGLPVFLAAETSSVRAFAQIPGVARRIPAGTFARLAGVSGPLHQLLLRYTLAFLTQVAQSAACNGAHLVEERCARWLLMTHDRVNGDGFPLTHEFLAFMLGVRRAGVTVAMRSLQDAGLLRYSRGRVEITDRAGLESASCECYAVVRAHFQRLVPQAARPS